MNDLPEDDVEKIARIFVNLGAPKMQANVMSEQLIKRAGQIAIDRGISKIEATENLLKQVVEARQGS